LLANLTPCALGVGAGAGRGLGLGERVGRELEVDRREVQQRLQAKRRLLGHPFGAVGGAPVGARGRQPLASAVMQVADAQPRPRVLGIGGDDAAIGIHGGAPSSGAVGSVGLVQQPFDRVGRLWLRLRTWRQAGCRLGCIDRLPGACVCDCRSQQARAE